MRLTRCPHCNYEFPSPSDAAMELAKKNGRVKAQEVVEATRCAKSTAHDALRVLSN